MHTAFSRKTEGKRPFGRPMHRMEDNIKVYLEEVEYVDWIYLA
jgi:hypothetical protein